MTVLPTIHLNGTSAETLRDEYRAARLAIGAAISKLEACTLNLRDFYPQQARNPSAWNEAQKERREAFESLAKAVMYCEAWEQHAQNWLDERDKARRQTS